MHHDQTRPGGCDNIGHLWIIRQATDVVNKLDPGGDSSSSNPALARINGERQIQFPGQGFNHRQHPVKLFSLVNRWSPGPGTFATDVNQGNTVTGHATRLLKSLSNRAKTTTIRE